MFTFGVNAFHVLSWSGNNTSKLCCILRSCRLYSLPNCRLYCTLYCCCYCCYSFRFSFLSYSFTACTYVCSLTLLLLPTHTLRTQTSHTALFLKGATPLLQEWQPQMHFHWSHWCGTILDFQWVMLTTFALLTKKPQFANFPETRWQVILFKFPIDWIYKLLLHYVVDKCFKFVVYCGTLQGQILYCIKV